jgi:hypothetical protein
MLPYACPADQPAEPADPHWAHRPLAEPQQGALPGRAQGQPTAQQVMRQGRVTALCRSYVVPFVVDAPAWWSGGHPAAQHVTKLITPKTANILILAAAPGAGLVGDTNPH